MSSKQFYTLIQRHYHKKFTTHYTCWNADLNLILVVAKTDGFIFQIINLLIETMRGMFDLA